MRRGVITVYLCLVLSVMLSLTAAGLYSARIAAGRVVLSSALEQSLFSLFGEYDRDLFRRYDLLLIDGGRGTETFRGGSLIREVEENAAYIIHPNKNMTVFSAADILKMSGPEAGLSGYVLATDQNDAAICRQAALAAKQELGAKGVQILASFLTGHTQALEAYTESEDGAGIDRAERAYDEMKNNVKEVSPEETEEGKPPENTGALQEADTSENPIESVRKIRKMDILALTLPEGVPLSAYQTEAGSLPSGRKLQKGMGIPENPEHDSGEKVLLTEYIIRKMPCFTDQSRNGGMQYQAEYAVAGKKSDEENLRSVVRQIMLIRQASNMFYLMTDPDRHSEVRRAAAALCSLFGQPELTEAIAAAIAACWAYGESVADLRELLDGGKIPLKKSDSSWQLSLASLSRLTERVDQERHSSQDGISYKSYLRLLLMKKNNVSLGKSIADLLEHNLRIRCGRTSFRIDSCMDAAEFSLRASAGGIRLEAARKYGYGR